MFESYKIRRLISKVIIAPDQDNTMPVRALREFGNEGLEALALAFKSGKITEANLKTYMNTFYDKSCLDPFIDLLSDSKEQVRTFAREILAKKAGQQALPRFIERLLDGDFLQRRALVDLISNLGNPSILNKIVPLLSENDRELKRAAMNIIVKVGGKSGSSYILPLLKSEDWWVRKRAAEVLSKTKDSSALEPLMEQLESERDPKIKMTIIQTIGELGNPNSARRILRHIADPDMIVRQMIVEALEKTADSTIVPDLIAVMKEDDVNVRRAAAEIIDKVKDPKAMETLIKCLQDKDWWVREIATDALTELKGHGLTEKVLALFKHPEENVRRAAVEFFNRSPSEEALPSLLKMLEDKDWWVREKAVMALGKLKNPRSIDKIVSLIDDSDVRWVIPKALGEIGGTKAIEFLGNFLSYPDRAVRIASIKSLGELKAKSHLPQIKECVKDSDAEVRDTALQVIKNITGRAVRASQIIEESQRMEGAGDSTIFSAPVKGGKAILSEAILVLDLCNSTGIAADYGDEFAFKLTNRLVSDTKPLSLRHNVRFTKSTGDGYLMTFNTVKDAAGFALDIMKTVSESNKKVPDKEHIDIRIAINMGETRIDSKGDRLGTAVNTTFRVEGVKPEGLIQSEDGMKPEDMPGNNRILITEPVNKEIAKIGNFKSRLIGFFEMKGITGQHRIFQLVWN